MTYYLVDFENTHEDGINLLSETSCEDIVLLFYTQNTSKINLDCLSKIKANIKIIKVPAGSQSLDMNLAFHLGSIYDFNAPDDKYIIVSHDTHFDCIINSLSERKYNNILRIYPLQPEKVPAEQTPATQKNKETPAKISEATELNNKVQVLLSSQKISSEVIGVISSLVVKNKGARNGKQTIYRSIITKYGQKQGLEYYNLIRKIL